MTSSNFPADRGGGSTFLSADGMRFGLLPLIARLLVTSEFLVAVRGKVFGWESQAAYMAASGMHFVTPLLVAALVIEAVGSLCLIAGWQAQAAATVMFVYLGIVSVRLHGFWNMTGMAAGGNMTQFFKNMGMMGCLLMIAVYGPGRWVVGRRSAPRPRSS